MQHIVQNSKGITNSDKLLAPILPPPPERVPLVQIENVKNNLRVGDTSQAQRVDKNTQQCIVEARKRSHVAGKVIIIVDITSRSFPLGHRWDYPNSLNFITRFRQHSPLLKGVCWYLFVKSA